MKNKIIILFATVLLTAISLSSCADFLDLEPEDGVIGDKFWQNKEEVGDAIMGCYANIMNRSNMEYIIWWSELRGDLVKPRESASNFAAMSQFQNGDISSTTKYTSWEYIYSVINNCNTVLNYAKETQKIDASFTSELLSQYEGEAKCIRALMYFYLVRTFKDVPYVTNASLSDNQEYRIAKTDGNVILDSLISDLKSVDRLANGNNRGVPFNYGASIKANKGRFTVWGLKALLADIYLWKEDYTNCNKECTQIINSGQYTLVPVQSTEVIVEDLYMNKYTVYYPSEGDANSLFTSMYVNGNSVESIFELQFGTDYQNPFYTFFNPINGTLTSNSEVLSATNLFIPSSLDRGWYDIRGEGIDYKQGYVWKWIGLSRTTYTFRALNESFSNWIFYRLADVMLMQAEALNQIGKATGNTETLKESLELVRKIRKRACAPESTDMIPDVNNLNSDDLERFILTERAREFAHEGKRWYDVLRNAKRDNFSKVGYLVELATYAASPDKVLSLQNKWLGNQYSLYLPINEEEIRVNNKLIQNPFYK
ncbi:MAG: RagB/SusD family nutrient uptake outer membrane protein [Paludibacteraceae bacterium]